jgi:hypothetical protein
VGFCKGKCQAFEEIMATSAATKKSYNRKTVKAKIGSKKTLPAFSSQ